MVAEKWDTIKNGIMGYNQFFRKIVLSRKHNVKMTPPWVLRVFRTARYHWLCRQVLFNEKDGLLLIPNISFYDAQSFLKNIFSVSFPCQGGTETILSAREFFWLQ